MSCTKSQEYLAKAGIEIDQRVDARKQPIQGKSVLELLDDIDELHVAKGKTAVAYDLKKDAPSQEMLLAAMLGPTGNLRAPTLRKGRTLIVGFNQAMYDALIP